MCCKSFKVLYMKIQVVKFVANLLCIIVIYLLPKDSQSIRNTDIFGETMILQFYLQSTHKKLTMMHMEVKFKLEGS